MKLLRPMIAMLVLFSVGCKVDFDAVEESVREARKGLSTYQWQEGSRTLEVSIKGDVTLNDAETEVASLEPEGFLKIEERGDSGRWDFEAVPGPGGQIQLQFQRDGEAVVSGNETREWLEGILPLLLRQTGLDAGGRITRMLRSGGSAAVVDEIEAISRGTVQRIYIEELLSGATPTVEEIRRLAKVAETMASSSDLERIVEQLADKYPDDEVLTEQLIDAVSELRSSSGRVRNVDLIVSQRKVGEGSAIKLAASLAEVRSASEKANGLTTLAAAAPPSARVSMALLDAAGTIRSSSEKSRAIGDILQRSEVNAELAIHASQVIQEISSSSERGRALRQLASDMPVTPEVLQSVLEASRNISSSSQDQVISTLLRREYARPELETILKFVQEAIANEGISSRLQDRIERQLALR